MKYRTRLIISISVLVVLALAVVSYLYIAEAMRQQEAARQHDEYVATHSTVLGVGDTLVLDSRDDDRGAEAGYVSGFDWTGSIEVTLLDAQYYKSLPDAGIGEDVFTLRNAFAEDQYSILVIHLRLKNIDATANSSRSFFSWGTFKVAVDDVEGVPSPWLLDEAYFDGTSEDVEDFEHNYYDYKLDIGEERVFTAAYYVQREYLNHDVYLAPGLYSTQKKYAFDLPDPVEGVTS